MTSSEVWGERTAERYDATSAGMFEREVLGPTVDLLAELAGDGPALELAVGTGRVAIPLAGRGVPVTGIELSPAMVDRYFSLFEAHVALVEGFVPPRISAPLFVWERARPDDRSSEIWRTCTSASVERAVVAGNHYDLMFPPLVEVLAAGVDAALRRVGETSPQPLDAHLDRREG